MHKASIEVATASTKILPLPIFSKQIISFLLKSLIQSIKDLTPKSVTKKLLSFNNVLITPHIAYNTRESIEILLEVTFNNIRNFVKGMHENQVC